MNRGIFGVDSAIGQKAARPERPPRDAPLTLVETAAGKFEVLESTARIGRRNPVVRAGQTGQSGLSHGAGSDGGGESVGELLRSVTASGYLTVAKIKPSGSLQARKTRAGAVQLFWRYRIGARDGRVSIGLYDSREPPKKRMPGTHGFSLAAARVAAEALATAHVGGKAAGGYPALQDRARAARTLAADAQLEAGRHTLENLLDHYCMHLASLGRNAHRDARSIFKLHVIGAWPQVAALPANEVTGEHVADMMRRLLEAGHGRTSNKLRSYMRAAFQTARAARSKASVPLHFKAYKVSANPVAETEPDDSQNKSAKHPLTADELRMYWQVIKPLPGIRGAALRLHLLTGGQRIEQLVRLLRSDVKEHSIRLFDGKGRPGKPARPHDVPLVAVAKAALRGCSNGGPAALSTDAASHLAATTLSRWAVEAAGDSIAGFQAKRIRSGVETLLARAGVPSDIRGRLQSHGVAGVQARHYDGHDYFDEKLAALELLYANLQRKPGAKVVLAKERA